MRPGAPDAGREPAPPVSDPAGHLGRFASRGLGALVSSPVDLLLLLLVGVLVVSLYLGVRDPLTVRIGFRNFLRGRRRTMVLLLGLLVGTAIISSSLVVGDTVGSLSTHFAYIQDGNVHEAVFAGGTTGGYQPFPYSFYLKLNASLSSQPYVAGVSPLLLAQGAASALDQTSGVPQTGMNLIGTDANVSSALGPFTLTSGARVPGPQPGEVLLNPTAAQDLDAKAGDHLLLNVPGHPNLPVTVLGLVIADGRGGFQDNGEGNVFVTVADAQTLLQVPNVIDYIAVTNVGGAAGGIVHTSAVMSEIQAVLPGIVAEYPAGTLPAGLAANNILQNDVSSAQSSSTDLTTLFLVIGLFSIVSGSILVVGIFVLLSEERRGQMGVARAVGMRRGQLVKSYYFEGLAYSAGSAFLGTLLGVGIAYLLIDLLVTLVDPGSSTEAVLASFTVNPSSLLIAYVTGFLLTLATVVVTVAYVSRLNIVRAIRSLPEPPLSRKAYFRLGLLGGGITLLGLLLVRAGLPSSVDIGVAELGVSFVILGVGLVAAALLPNRLAMTAMGAALLLFWGDLPLRQDLFGANHGGSIFVFFLEGIFLILAAIVIYLFNADLVMRGLRRLLERDPKRVPVVMVAFSYPGHKPFRTGMTLSIFAMVLFTIVAIASIGNGIAVNLDQTVASQSGGFSMAGTSDAPIPGFASEIRNNSTLSPEISTVIPFYSAQAYVSPATGSPFQARIAAAPMGLPPSEDFYTANHFNFSSTLNGMSATQVWKTLQNDPTAVVASGNYGKSSGFSLGPSGHGLRTGEMLNLSIPGTSITTQVHVVGIMAETLISTLLLNPGTMTGTLHSNRTTLFLLTLSSQASAQQTIYDLKKAFFASGLQLVDFQQTFAATLQFLISFIDLLEVFVALGLVVGIAAIGILAFRAIVERRSEIGMLRAVGFKKRQVLVSFFIEYSFLALLGIGMGVALGALLAYNLSESASGILSFSVPWGNVALIVVLSYALTILATGVPSYRASRIAPAEALRYSE